MRLRFLKPFGTALLLCAAPVAAVTISQSPQAAAEDEAAEGRIVEISPEAESEAAPAVEQQVVEAPKYWIGLQGRPIDSDALRTHLQLADDVGVLVETVVADSPAEKAGLQRHDVIVAVNGEPISELAALQKVVADGGDKQAIELKVIRVAQETKVEVTPAERPADAPVGLPTEEGAGQGGAGPLGDVESLLRQLQEQGGGVRVFGPGMIGGRAGLNLNAMPGGVSVSIARQDEGPAEITVKKNDETWTFKSDDAEAIKKLPEEVQPFVQQMLDGSRPVGDGLGAMRFNFGDFEGLLPDQLGKLGGENGVVDREALRKRAGEVRRRTEAASERLLERMEQMEQRIRELQRQLDENQPAPRTNDADETSSN